MVDEAEIQEAQFASQLENGELKDVDNDEATAKRAADITQIKERLCYSFRDQFPWTGGDRPHGGLAGIEPEPRTAGVA